MNGTSPIPAAVRRPGMQLAAHTAIVADDLRTGRVDISQFAQESARLGCRAIEIDPGSGRDVAAIRRAAEQVGLAVIFASDVRLPSDADEAGPAAAALQTAAELGAGMMRILPPNARPQWAFLKRAEDVGVRLLLGNEPVPGSVLRVRALVDAADSPWLLALLDTAAPMFAGEDPVRSVYLLNRRLGHVHMTDVRTLMGHSHRTYPGDGTLWWYGLIWALGALGYRHYLSIVFPGEGRGGDLLRCAVDHLTRVHAARFAGPVPWV